VRLSDWIVGIMVALFGLVGLLLAANAYDDEMYLFGVCLAGFAFIFDVGLVKGYYDSKESGHG
jgi:hypothetical protein